MPANRFNGFYRLRHRDWPAHSALPAHLRAQAGGGLVRDHLRKLHGGWRAPARACSTRFSSSTASCSTASPCISARPSRLNREHLRRLKTLVKRTKTPWLTDHLCWGSVDGRYTHDLLPMPYTFEAAAVTARKIREARDFLEMPDRRGKREQLRGISRFRND